MRILVTGATGYIGGRLVPRLLESGHHVVCLSRSKRKLSDRIWAGHERVEIVEGDASDGATMATAMAGADVAYYLVHSMVVAGEAYATRDLDLATTFARSAEQAGVSRIIYLGGLGETGDDLSTHLLSRRQVERALASTSVPVTVLRAAMIIGSGSASFEILRYLVERLPVMITPRWVITECQPIAIRDVLRYLKTCLEVPETVGKTLDVGGRDIVNYRQLMRDTAEVRGLAKRIVIPVPVLTPRLSSLWIHLITPLDRRIARPLAEGLSNRVVCRDNEAQRLMPFQLLSAREAIQEAHAKLDGDQVETSWSDGGVIPGDPDWAGGQVFVDRREIVSSATPAAMFDAICRIGGGHGWYAADFLWKARGWIDRLVGGPGLRRGRRHRDTLGYGDVLDFWRVTDIVQDRQLELRAEMKLPGQATLSFEIQQVSSTEIRLIQIARFKPQGLMGLAYWYSVLPLHGIVFRGMLNGIRKTAEERSMGERTGDRRSSAVDAKEDLAPKRAI